MDAVAGSDGEPAVDAPEMAGWNLAVRFVIELASLIGLGVGGAAVAGIAGAVLAPLCGIAAWGAFNVPGDPSRSGRAPVPVGGAVRLTIEGAVFLTGATGWLIGGAPAIALVVLAAAIVVTATSLARVRWLLER